MNDAACFFALSGGVVLGLLIGISYQYQQQRKAVAHEAGRSQSVIQMLELIDSSEMTPRTACIMRDAIIYQLTHYTNRNNSQSVSMEQRDRLLARLRQVEDSIRQDTLHSLQRSLNDSRVTPS